MKKVATIGHKGHSFEVDEDGFLLRPEDWSEEWVERVMELEGLKELTAGHVVVLVRLRAYYEKNGKVPHVRTIHKVVGFTLKRIFEMFPSGPKKGACKMAGLGDC